MVWGAEAFFPANLAALLAAVGPESHGVLGALQRMAINLGTAVDVTVAGTLLTMGTSPEHPVSILGVRASWAYGMSTLLIAVGGIGLARWRQLRA